MNRRKQLEQQRLLSIFHYIVGAMVMLFSLFPVMHLAMGISMLVAPDTWNSGNSADQMPAFFPIILILFALAIIIIGEMIGILIIHAGRMITQRKKYMFTFVMAAIQCMFTPFGTVLGIFTIIYLQKDFVRKSYGIIDEDDCDETITEQ